MWNEGIKNFDSILHVALIGEKSLDTILTRVSSYLCLFSRVHSIIIAGKRDTWKVNNIRRKIFAKSALLIIT